jgi:hypothetical protein
MPNRDFRRLKAGITCETYRLVDPEASNGEAKTQCTGVRPHFETVPVVTPSRAYLMGLEPVDIDESPRALLPVRAGRHVGDADKSPNEIHRIKILPYVAALDRAFH